MSTSKNIAALLLCTLGICAAQAEESTSGNSSSVIDKTGRAINKGAKATADGAEYVAKKVVGGIETGARATGRALNSAADAVGIDTGNSKKAPEKAAPADTTASPNQ